MIEIILVEHAQHTHSVYIQGPNGTTGLDYMADSPNAAYHARTALAAAGITAEIRHVNVTEWEVSE